MRNGFSGFVFGTFTFAVSAVVACGGGTTPTVTGGDGGSDAAPSDGSTVDVSFGDAASFCAAKGARDQSCGGSADPVACAAIQACIEGAMRPANIAGYESCLATRPCNVSEDSCIGVEEAKYAQDSTVVKFHTDCLARHAACLEAGASFTNDYCATFGVFTDGLRASWSACLGKPCDQVNGCFGDLAKSVGCK